MEGRKASEKISPVPCWGSNLVMSGKLLLRVLIFLSKEQ